MQERNPREIAIDEAFRSNHPWLDRKLFTSDKWVAGTNFGGMLFTDIIEVPQSLVESFRNSKVGQVLGKKGFPLPGTDIPPKEPQKNNQ